MDPVPMMNDASYANGPPANTTPFHLPEIWHFPPPGVAALADSALGLRFAHFGDFAAAGPTREVPGDDPINSEQRPPIPNRKRRDSEEESAKGASTSNGGANANANATSDGGDGKRMKTTGNNRNESGKGEAESSSGKPAEQQQTNTTPEPPKQDYIHVRARRGQATDSHSLAERARREKISERMKILQDLVPGCNKVIGKALVLDEIINYIQSLQRQVEFLSMKLEAVNSRLTPGIEVFPPKDFDQQTFDTAGIPFASQATREYRRSSSPEWLHMQVGGGFERTS